VNIEAAGTENVSHKLPLASLGGKLPKNYECRLVNMTRRNKWRHDIPHKSNMHNDIQHNDTQHHDTQYNDYQHTGTP